MPRTTRRPLLALAVGLLAVTTLAACGDSEPTDALGNRLDGVTTTGEPSATTVAEDPASTEDTTVDTEPIVPDQPPAPEGIPVTPADAAGCRTAEQAAAETETPESDLPADLATAPFATDDIPGCGEPAEAGSGVSFNYVLRLGSTGEVVQSSFGSTPLDSDLNPGSLIAGFTYGVPGMRVGGRRTLVLPPEYGYGEQGTSGIPGGETLIFVVDLLAVS